MEIPNFKLAAEEYEKILLVISSLNQRLKAESVFLINRTGQEIAHEGTSSRIDVQALSSLAASNLAATFGLASLIGEREFERIFHKGDKTNILMTPVGEFAFLLFLLKGKEEHEVDLKSVHRASLILEDVLKKCSKRLRAAR
jgi:predicted regulator of Ras-like GTPase activity (Roadblock/LC7/MglB family)